jgi:hypothetical protein
MNPDTYEVVASSRLFFLRQRGIEYVLGAQVWDDAVHIFTSVWDRESWVGIVPMSVCEAMLQPSPSVLRRSGAPPSGASVKGSGAQSFATGMRAETSPYIYHETAKKPHDSKRRA